MKCLTFGDFLNNLMENRKLSKSALTKLLGEKSRNTVNRIISGESTYDRIKLFSDKILNCSELALSNEEKNQMELALQNSKYSKITHKAYDNLLSLYSTDMRTNDNAVCLHINGKESRLKKTLGEIINDCSGFNTTIYIENVASVELVYALNNLISFDKSEIKITQFFYKDGTEINTSLKILSAMKLLPFLCYTPYECNRNFPLSNSIYILKELNDKKYNLQILQFYNDNEFDFLETTLNSDILHFYSCKYDSYAKASISMRTLIFDNDIIGQMPDFLKFMQKYDKFDTITVSATTPFMLLPFKTVERMITETNYIGLGKENELAQQMYKTLKERLEYIESDINTRHFIITKCGLKKFLQDGRTSDHFELFPGLPPEERILVMKRYLERCNNGKEKLHIRLLKEQYSLYNTEIGLYLNAIIYIFDPIWGYWNNYCAMFTNNSSMMNLLEGFLKNFLWDDCCYSENESYEIIKGLLE